MYVCALCWCVYPRGNGGKQERGKGERVNGREGRGGEGERERRLGGKRDRQRNWGRQVNAGQQIENTSQPNTMEKVWNMWQQFVSCRTEVNHVQVESKTVLKISITNYETSNKMHNCYNTSILSPVAEPALLTLQKPQKHTKMSLWNSVLRLAPCVYSARPPQKHTKPVK